MTQPKRVLQLATPCDNRWEDLEPRDGGRYCEQCDRVVVDLMHVTESEAWRRFDAAGGDLCVRMREDARGDGVFRYEPSARKGVGAAVLTAALAAACSSGAEEPAAAAPIEAAEVAPPSPPTPEPAMEPVADTPPDDFHVIEAEDGSDHPAHEGEQHTAVHHRERGRMGGARAIRRDPNGADPLGSLEGL